MKVKRYSTLMIVILIIGCTTNKQHASVAFDLMKSGDCISANNYARQNLSGDNLTMVQSGIAEFCSKDNKLAIQLLRKCASSGREYCIDRLTEKGIKPPLVVKSGMSGEEFIRRLGNAGQAYNESIRQSTPSTIVCRSTKQNDGSYKSICQ
jgi:hypothetical protein